MDTRLTKLQSALRRKAKSAASEFSFLEYVQRAQETLLWEEDETQKDVLFRMVLGLMGELGEVSETLKKHYRGDNGAKQITPELVDKITLELGDVLWYMSNFLDVLVYDLPPSEYVTLEDVARRNVEKLAKRKKANTLRGSGDNR